jgi:imidazolonepropionase
MGQLITNIKELLQVRESNISKVSGKDMKTLPVIKDAYLLIEDGFIADYGSMKDAPVVGDGETINAKGKIVLPAWCDSHTHIVYAGDRSREFVDRINGLSYEEIAHRGGGILNSAKKLQQTSDVVLFAQSVERVRSVMAMGTGAIEIKSGYGLTAKAELKMLRVIARIKKELPVKVKATFLGAHAVPESFANKKAAYVNLIIENMMPKVAAEGLADYVDVFCEKGYFSLEDTRRILTAASSFGLLPKLHVNQFNAFGGVALGVRHNALSVDHLEELNDEDIVALKNTNTMPVALPSCSYFLGIPYTPARKLIDAGLPLAVATDYNPGSAPSGNMNFVVSTACIKMKMTPEEAINAATINGAYAMGISDMYGSISKGKKANLIITKNLPGYHYLPYAFGDNHIDSVLINGMVI